MGVYPMTAGEARGTVVDGSVTRALQIGTALANAAGDPVEAVRAAVGGCVLAEGKVIDVGRDFDGRYTSGHTLIERRSDGDRHVLRLEFQNEYVAALEEGRLVASAPDVIAVLDAVTGAAIGVERLRYGQQVSVVAFPSDARWETEAGLRLTGPRAFGYDFEYEPIRERESQRA
jgi:DUF917 family protein